MARETLLLTNRLDEFVLRGRPRQMPHRTTGLLGKMFGSLSQLPGHVLGIGHEVLNQHADKRQKGRHSADDGEQSERPAKPHPIKTAQHPQNLVLVALYKVTHGVAPAVDGLLEAKNRVRYRSNALSSPRWVVVLAQRGSR